MSLAVGIVGLPNVGKSSLFQALTAQTVDTSNYPFATIDPNVGVVTVPDARLDALRDVIIPQKVTPSIIEFIDIAGLVRGAHTGEGLGNEFLSHIQRADAIVHVIRAFRDPEIEHVEGAPDLARDFAIIVDELKAKDRAVIAVQRDRLEGKARSGDQTAREELALMLDLETAVEKQKQPARPELKKLAKRLGILSVKPFFVILNVGRDPMLPDAGDFHLLRDALRLNLREEADVAMLTPEERRELNVEGHTDILIRRSYDVLTLATFFTIKGGVELRAWTAPAGTTAPEAGGVVHTDFQERFIRAEVIDWNDLVKAGGWKNARARGLIRTEGKEYTVRDGDVIEFKV